jgi:hypothetical protein
MSTPISPTRLPPSSFEQRALIEEHTSKETEATRRHLVSQIGFWSALLTAVLGMAYIVAEVANALFGFPARPWNGVTLWAPSLFLAPAFVILLVCVQHRTPVERRIWSSIAVPLGAVYAALCSTVYFVELTLVIPHQLSGNVGSLGILVFGAGTFLQTVDIFGYAFMSLAAAFAAPAFGGSRLENWIRWLLLANWPLAFLIPLQMFWPTLVNALVAWVLTIPVPAMLLAVLFRQDQRRAA